jgi:hypothetical protein
VRRAARLIDDGVREAVAFLNRIPGIATKGSCQGLGPDPGAHPHADAAYVLFRHPLPLQAEAFLAAQLDTLGRVEDDGVYSRWPEHNRVFLDRLADAARTYLTVRSPAQHELRWPLTKLRAALAAVVAQRAAGAIALCLRRAAIIVEPQPPAHGALPLVALPADQEAQWFAIFAQHPDNALDAALVAADGWAFLIERSRRGDFGPAFHRRWLHYRGRMLAETATRQLRRGADAARALRPDLDFFYDDSHAVFRWGRD